MRPEVICPNTEFAAGFRAFARGGFEVPVAATVGAGENITVLIEVSEQRFRLREVFTISRVC